MRGGHTLNSFSPYKHGQVGKDEQARFHFPLVLPPIHPRTIFRLLSARWNRESLREKTRKALQFGQSLTTCPGGEGRKENGSRSGQCGLAKHSLTPTSRHTSYVCVPPTSFYRPCHQFFLTTLPLPFPLLPRCSEG